MPTALVTGATAGIGLAYAHALANRGFDLVVVARNESRLQDIAKECISKFGINVEVLGADLSDRAAVDRVAKRAAQDDIELVVNNAGFGLNEAFTSSTVEDEQVMLDVLVTAVMRITHATLPGMLERNHGGVINVSSVASWLSSGTYSAAKSWVTTFSESLATQHKDSKVHVIAVCPGFTRTEFHERANMETETIPRWMWLDVNHVVEKSLRDFAKRRPVSVAGTQYKVLALVAQYLPRPFVRVISNVERKR